MKTVDLTEQRFNRLTALYQIAGSRPTSWRCKCDCGAEINVQSFQLRNGRTKSCGCFRRERGAVLLKTHGESGANRTRTYTTWMRMIARCTNPKIDQYRYYGARGISVCDRWRNSYEAFRADMGERPANHTIDRINSDGNYEPGNCRWATPLEQSRNRIIRVKQGRPPRSKAVA